MTTQSTVSASSHHTSFNLESMRAGLEARLQALPIGIVGESLRVQPRSGDAGFRRYFELNTEQPLLAVYAPPATEDTAAFVAIARYLREQGVITPRVLAVDLEQGWLLVEKLGAPVVGQLYSEVLQVDRRQVDELYPQALESLVQLQRCPTITIPAADGEGLHSLPKYSEDLLLQEMSLFHQWFIPQLLGYDLSDAEHELLQSVYWQLQASALQQPQVWVHRDFHCRNLIYRQQQTPGVIDFQDAVRGPITYDLVSLLRDCYIRWPRQQVTNWALAYGDRAVAEGLMAPITQQGFLRWFDWMGLQRHLKVLGIFARLYLRDGKAGYLKDLPLVLRYTLEVAADYPEFADFVYWFKEKLLPLCEQQEWYQDYTQAGEYQEEVSTQ